jgi:hypothetical protein
MAVGADTAKVPHAQSPARARWSPPHMAHTLFARCIQRAFLPN